MRYRSTRAAAEQPGIELGAALAAGLADDGGLYVPAELPNIAAIDPSLRLPAVAEHWLRPFFADSTLASALPQLCAQALDLPLPRVNIGDQGDQVLELFHGPTAAFKDFGARFLAACLAALRAPDEPTRTILVATSGDTGAAVAGAFHRLPGFRVLILYPDGRVSARQAHQLGAFGDNVHCYRVDGSFDDCQRMVKQAFRDEALRERCSITSANSISLGRLLPQATYYAHACAAHSAETGADCNLIIPTGNLGNALAAMLVRACGGPIDRIVLASNANRVLPDLFAQQRYQGRPSVATLANAMDVGDPSNYERLAWLYPGDSLFSAGIEAEAVDDQQIRQRIVRCYQDFGYVACPHTACALELLARKRERGDGHRWLIAATAHPAKFETVVEPLLEHGVPPPPALAALLAKPSHADPLPADYAALRAQLIAIS